MTSYDTRRRCYLRAQIKSHLTIHDTQGDIDLAAFDISQGGAYIHSSILFEAGEEIRVSFQLPTDGYTISTRAKVVRGDKASGDPSQSGMGLEFLDLSQQDKRAIADYVVQMLNTSF